MMISEGSASDEMFIVVSGKVTVKKAGQVISEKEKGAVFGEMGLFDHAPRSASVLANKATTVMVITRKDLLGLLRRDSQVAVKLLWALTQELNQRLRATSEDLAHAKASLESLGRVEAPFPLPPET
jgi:CRP-like cAMP-binding protein